MGENFKQRDYSLDFIKIVATVFIIFHHYQQVTGAWFENRINFNNGRFYFGYIVELFFILSGYFMYSYIRKIQQGRITFPEFYFKRLSRLFPVMALGAVTYEIFLAVYQYLYQTSWFDIQTTFWGIIIASFGIQDGWALSNPCVNNPTWYISVLMLCYVVFFMLVYISKRLKISPQYLFIFMIFLGMGINTYGINLPFLNASSSRGYYAFFFGIILAGILKEKKIGKQELAVSCSVLVLITALIVWKSDFMSNGINYIMTYVYYPALIIVCKADIIRKLLNKNIIGKIGRISFDVYIWHNPFYILMYIFIKIFKWNLNLNSYRTMIGYAIVCFIFGGISFYFIEQPLTRWIEKKVKFQDPR